MSEKVIDFESRRKQRKSAPKKKPFSGGPKWKLRTFILSLVLAIAFIAFIAPQYISSGLFAPAVILVAVLATLGLERAMVRSHVNRLHKEMEERKARENNNDKTTFH